MKKYEIMFIVKATQDSEEIKKTANAMKENIASNRGSVVDFKELGEKKLAYPIKKEINGYYYVMTVEAGNETISEFDRKAFINENVLRHLIIKLDEE